MSDRTSEKRGFATRLIHGGYDRREAKGALVPPIYMTSTYGFETTNDLQQIFTKERKGHAYGRVGNPTQAVWEARMAELEGAEAACAVASGMGAVAATIWTLVSAGDEIIADKTLYGCTFAFLEHGLTRFGVKTHFIDLTDPANLEAAIGDKTRIVLFESPANPNMRLVDIAAIAAIAHRHDAKVIVDNTYCTPYLQRPIERGADVVLHSATKYLGGHGDLLAGVIASRQEVIDEVRGVGLKDMTGAVISPFNAFLLTRGLKTLELRMDRHCESAQRIAEWLEGRPEIDRLYYPGLSSHPQYALCKRQMRMPGAMIAFELKGGIETGVRFMDALNLWTRAVSLGDCESLVQHPASMTHATYAPEERAAHLISDGLVRLSVGLETCSDLIEDLDQAFAALKAGV